MKAILLSVALLALASTQVMAKEVPCRGANFAGAKVDEVIIDFFNEVADAAVVDKAVPLKTAWHSVSNSCKVFRALDDTGTEVEYVTFGVKDCPSCRVEVMPLSADRIFILFRSPVAEAAYHKPDGLGYCYDVNSANVAVGECR